MDTNFSQLKEFLFEANAHGYASDPQRIIPQRPNFQEIEYRRGEWTFRDSFAGHFFAPGQEIVYFKNQPVWAMAYAGGMKFEHHNDEDLTKKTFKFLKTALLQMDPAKPYRGPSNFKDGDWHYLCKIKGDVQNFTGNECIFYQNNLVFEQNIIGGVIIKS